MKAESIVKVLALFSSTNSVTSFVLRRPLPEAVDGRALLSSRNSEENAVSRKPSTRWTESSRWESDETNLGSGEQYILKEKYGTYFRVPNPSLLMTKIICTIGPATMDPTTLGRMMDAGMSAARINMSHGDFKYAEQVIDNVRTVAKSRNKLCPIILDTKGPEIRVKQLTMQKRSIDDGSVIETMPLVQMNLESGDGLVLLTGCHSSHEHTENEIKDMIHNFLESPPPTSFNRPPKTDIIRGVTVTYPNLSAAVTVGDVVLLDDGRISLIVTKKPNDSEVHTQVIEGGILKQNKGVNLPGCRVDLPHITEKDVEDILFGVSKNVEFIAHSFTRSAAGLNQLRELPGVVESGTHIIAKIENQEALDNIDAILRCCDGIMVARGDLGVEIPLERVCSVQKRLVASCNAIGKPVIVATELLDSMINHPRPTRAEASDVANAVFDGADCVMLSGETAVGKYPVESIQVMTRICKEAELDVASSLRAMAADGGKNGERVNAYGVTKPATSVDDRGALRDAFAKSAIVAAKETNADLILAITRTGLTANALAKFFSSVPVMVVSTNPNVCAQVLLHRSVTPYLVKSLNRESCVPRAMAKAVELGIVTDGSRVLLLTGPQDDVANRLETFIVGEEIVKPPPSIFSKPSVVKSMDAEDVESDTESEKEATNDSDGNDDHDDA